MKLLHIAMLLLCACCIVSCSTSRKVVNNRISAVRLAAIRQGTTTREQVRALLGDPLSTKTQTPLRQPPGVPPLPVKYTAAEIWAFQTDINKGTSFHLPFTARPVEKPPCTVIIFFDERGIVLDCETSGEVPN
ncbi:MAG TPA: hypothetical protein VMJ66_01785 [Geobacteraceae bacterium]|nr:hypothetical protein [Geobacteraceae bacterium]